MEDLRGIFSNDNRITIHHGESPYPDEWDFMLRKQDWKI
jgi:hypothetical protein